MLLGLFMEVLCTSAARVFSQSRSAELSYTQLQLSSQLFSGQRLAACFSQSHRHSAELSHTQLQLSSQRGGSDWRLVSGFGLQSAEPQRRAQLHPHLVTAQFDRIRLCSMELPTQ